MSGLKEKFNIIRGAIRGDIDEVRNALQEDPACVNKQEAVTGWTALRYAASSGEYSMVDLLCNAEGIKTSIPDIRGRTPAHLAWVIGREDIKRRINRERDERLRAKLDEEDGVKREIPDNVVSLAAGRKPKPS
ncbi:MAG: hypothetical protein H6853_07615 [Rhodospirillales bacterium]|nr:hypothetical protein [Alphaproteobacteria bacterium]USO03388.1 MAG: hypothetical protein H6853_07615 [Rhodospirillales bacterium]